MESCGQGKGDGTDDVDVKFDRVEDDDVKDIDTYRDVDVFETDWFLLIWVTTPTWIKTCSLSN